MTREQWRTNQYVPRQGEPVCESDTGFMKVGDGVHRFPDLRYLTGPQGVQGIQGIQGPPGRDGVVTFENLSTAQRASLKGDRGEPGQAGERGHSLTANVRIEGNYRNGVNSQLNVIADVYYDGTRLSSGYTVDFYYRGFGNNNWTSQLNQRPDANGKIAQWSSAQRSGGYLEVYIVVTYQGIKAAASTRLDNVQDGARGEPGQPGPKGADGLSINENLLPDSNIGIGYNKPTWTATTNSGLLFNTDHAIQHFGRGLHIWGTPNAEYKGVFSANFPLVAKEGDKLTFSIDLGKDALTENSIVQFALHYLNDNNQILAQEWQELDLATQGFEVKKYKRISKTFTAGKDMTMCRVMIYAAPGRLINFYIDNIKLERGTVATAWCPAYVDLIGPVYRIAKEDIPGTGEGGTQTINKNIILNPDGIKVGDIVQDIFVTENGTQEGYWKVTNVNGNSITVNGIGMRNLTSYNDITRRITTLENRPAPTGFVNQKTGQPMNYWMGSKQEFDAISNKDDNTVYDYYE